jgi:hypothetical protein
LTNYGEATLNIGGIAASGNFSETNTCGATLAPGANCPINVSFSPATAGVLTGSLSVSDNDAGSPQTITLNGTGAASGTPVLNGLCQGPVDGGNACGAADDLAECPAGVVATTPANVSCGATSTVSDDTSRTCSAVNSHNWILRDGPSLCII